MVSRDFLHPKLCNPLFVHHHRPRFSVSIVAKTAPRPLLRFKHQTAFHRILVRVAQFLEPLIFRPYDKVIETRPPDMSVFQRCGP